MTAPPPGTAQLPDTPADLLVQQLLDALAEGVYGIDAEGRATFLNPAAAAMLGYEPAAFIGARQHDAIHHQTPGGGPCPEDQCPIYAVLRDGQPRHVSDEFFHRRDGTTFPVEYKATPLRDGERIVGAVVAFRDVSANRRTEEALRVVRERQEALLENLPDAAWLKDADLRFAAVNAAFLRAIGRTREEVEGRTTRDLLPAADAARYEDADRRLLRDGKEVTVLEQLPWGSTDGELRWVETVKRPIIGADGRPAGVAALSRDVTERKRRQDEDRFLAEAGQAIIASLGWGETIQGLVSLLVPRLGDWCVAAGFGPDGEIEQVEGHAFREDVRAAVQRLIVARREAFGPAGELAGRTLVTRQGVLFPRLSATELDALVGRPHEAVTTLTPASLLLVPLATGGSTSGILVLGRQGQGLAFDTDELRLVEEVALRAALAIEHARQHRRATEALEARDEVLRIVAHDLHGMVAQACLASDALAGAVTEPAGRKEAAAVARALERMDRLIRDLLEVSRVEPGWLPLNPTRLASMDLLREAAEAAAPLARSRDIRIVVEAGGKAAGEGRENGADRSSRAASGTPRVPDVMADRGRALQVFSNLLGNALAFTPPGGTIRLEAAVVDAEVVFSVRDTGPGIAPEDLPHVFDRFWRAKRAPQGGSGLGLAISRGIVAGHGGRIWATSEVGRGSSFSFTLRQADDPEEARTPTAEDVPGAAEAGSAVLPSGAALPSRSTCAARILVVDDHDAIRAGVRSVLAGVEGLEVVDEAADGGEAVRRARHLSQEDLVVMDLTLPDMDGFEATRQIRARHDAPRVVILTAHAPEASLMKALEAGASGYVRKAAAHRDLAAALWAACRGEVFLDPHGNHVLLHALERTREIRRRLGNLTSSEREVVRLTAEGYTGPEVAKRLFLSPNTVSVYRTQAMHKLGFHHRSELVRFALDADLVAAD